MALPARTLRRQGLGDAPNTAPNTAVTLVQSTTNQALPGYGDSLVAAGQDQVSSIYSNLPPEAQSAIQQGQSILQASRPAINFAVAASQGQVDMTDPATQLQALSAVAAVAATVNPIAGAAVMAGGALVVGFEEGIKGIFTACGLYSPPWPSYTYQGLLRIGFDQVPYAPYVSGNSLSYDPLWIHVKTFQDLQKFTLGGDANHPTPSGLQTGPDTMYGMWRSALTWEMSGVEQWQWINGAWKNGVFVSSTSAPPANFNSAGNYPDPQPFERYLNGLLNRTFEYWGNGQPHVPLRMLLQIAARNWNSLHAATSTQTYQGKPSTGSSWPAPQGHANNMVELIMGPAGVTDQLQGNTANDFAKINNMPPLTINTGPLTQTTASSATVSPVVGASLAVATGSAAMVGAYSLITGKSVLAAAQGIWKSIVRSL